MSGSRFQVQQALGQALWHEARAHGLAGQRASPVQGVEVMGSTIGPGLKAQRARGPCTVQLYCYF